MSSYVVASTEVVNYLPVRVDRNQVRIVTRNGQNWYIATPREALCMAERDAVEAVVNKAGYLKFLRLTIDEREGWKLLRRMFAPEQSPLSITRKKQDPGAAEWVQRADRAKSGLIGGTVRRIWTAA